MIRAKCIWSPIAMLALLLSLGCSDDAAPGDCIDAARDAGVPDRVVEWMQQPPGDLGAMERIAIREALEKFGLGDACRALGDEIAVLPADLLESSGPPPTSAMTPRAPQQASAPPPLAPTPRAPRQPSAPLPAPTVEPSPTPLPAPTVEPSPTPIPAEVSLFYEIPQVVNVTFSGTAGRSNSRITVHFDEPVVAVQPPGSRNGDANSSSGIKLVVEYPSGGGSDQYIPLRTKTSIKSPSSSLSFGPVEEEFAFAFRISLKNDTSIIDVDGNHATISFAPTVFVNPGYSDDIMDNGLTNCIAFMELSGVSPIIVQNAKTVRSGELTDEERIEWRILLSSHFTDYFDELLKLPCVELWSDAANDANAGKRNDDFRAECTGNRIRNNGSSLQRADVTELLNRPYTILDVADRVMLRDLTGNGRNGCSYFYPQLFYGLWIPIDKNR